jgi:Cyclic nucleotide-binding domain
MANHLLDLQNLVHLGALLYLVCFMFRNQLVLRLLAVAGDICYSAYFFVAADRPLWSAMTWSLLNVAVNLFMIALILREARMSDLADHELNLFRNLRGLSPGQFRKLMKVGQWHNAEIREQLTEEGKMPDRLYYVLEGQVQLRKSGREIPVEPSLFIGELAYLRGKPATATVHVEPKSVYVSWSHQNLNDLFSRSEEMRSAMAMLLNNDLAEKVARS